MTKLTDRERELQAEVDRLRASPAPERLRPARVIAHEIMGAAANGCLTSIHPEAPFKHSGHCDHVAAAIEADRAARQPADVERLRALLVDGVTLADDMSLVDDILARVALRAKQCEDLKAWARQARGALKP